jgi:hypothetical protein
MTRARHREARSFATGCLWGIGLLMQTETISQRVAQNQHAFREANEQIQRAADGIGLGSEMLPFICECHARDCTRIVRLSRDEYEKVRGHGDTFLVAPGHEVMLVDGVQIAHVGQKYDHFTLMVKVGEAGTVARELDARTPG